MYMEKHATLITSPKHLGAVLEEQLLRWRREWVLLPLGLMALVPFEYQPPFATLSV
tara:strand:+ start:674 stop:841 length:168 start_codon:yes stop_codon:yes gene_type:complete